MKIVQFKAISDNKPKIGLLTEALKVVDLSPDIPYPLVDFLNNHENALQKIQAAGQTSKTIWDLTQVKLLAPITKPDKVLGIGLNYKEYCDAVKTPYPPEPVVFSKFSSTIVGPFDEVHKPNATKMLDWEVELVVVIGKKTKEVTKDKAYDHILGYTVAQDLTARDWMTRNGGQFLLSKTMDQFCPLGPCIVTKDQIEDPHNMKLHTWVNNVEKQNGCTDQLVHRIDDLIVHLSSVMTLLPGDLILTGTPSGVGFVRKPQEFLKPGDVLRSEIEGIGQIENRIV